MRFTHAAQTTDEQVTKRRRRSSDVSHEESLIRTPQPGIAAVAPSILARHDSGLLTPKDVLSLQRTIGNRAASELLRSLPTRSAERPGKRRPARGIAQRQEEEPQQSLATVLPSAGTEAAAKSKQKTVHKPDVSDEAEEMEESEKPKSKGKGGPNAGGQIQRFSPTKISSGKMFDYSAKQVTPSFPLWRPPSKRSNSDASTTTPRTPKMSGRIAWDKAASK